MAVYVCGDLHGHLEIYKKIKSMLNPEDIVYCLGDCGDRGPDSWATIKAVYEDPQFIYLKGNHEDILIKACEDYLDNDEMWDYYSYTLSCVNGGKETLEDWESDPDRLMWLRRLKNLPTWETYENPCGVVFVLCHAGFTPWLKEGTLNERITPADNELLWDREHFFDEYSSIEMDNVIVIHGHTPIQYLSEDLGERKWAGGAFWYCNDHKVCIDSGGFFSDEWILLNLDTLEDRIIMAN